jgi:glyoxylase-like metal-dependent hydrolase (beta-lactamase superfamily II)
MEPLTDRLYRLLLGRFQAYLWRDGDDLTLIDTGAADTAPEVAAALEELGVPLAGVSRIVLTHHHDDHTGSAAEIRQWAAAEVVAHAADAPVISGRVEPPRPAVAGAQVELYERLTADVPAAPPCPVDVEVRGGDVIDFAGGARVISAPGHTDGSIALHLPEHGVLLTGDAIGESMGSIVPGFFNVDGERMVESVRRLAALDVDVAAFGHGEPVVGRAAHRLREMVAGL